MASPADEPGPTCGSMLNECELLLDQASKIIDQQELTISMLEQQNDRLRRSLDYNLAELAKERAWYRDPKLVAPIGFVLGVALGAYVVKK